jgi:tRNA 2-thiouridine synthesizing protein A
MKKTIDTRGLSCPQPVILTRNVIKDMKKGEVSVLVDTMTQVYNVTRSAERLGWAAGYEKKDDEYIVTLNR